MMYLDGLFQTLIIVLGFGWLHRAVVARRCANPDS